MCTSEGWGLQDYTQANNMCLANNNTNSYRINLTLDILLAHISKEVLQKHEKSQVIALDACR